MVEKKTIEVTDTTFDDIVQKNKYVVIDCWAAWCGPCNILTPIIEQLAEENPEVVFCKLNVDQNRKISSKYGIMSIPTLLYFKEGKLSDKTLGALPKKTLEGRIQKLVI
ncbi:thioredoxin [Candidatus Bathyarchaeota archaeon]|nr:thioredoxin [Candidatus Bathyarchaeota archaeon]